MSELEEEAVPLVMRWVPVSESLPADDAHMILVTRYGETDIAFWRNGKFLEEPMGVEADGVTAWMRLPAPFKAILK